MTAYPHKYYEYMNICRDHGLFTCGTTEQYHELALLYQKTRSNFSLRFVCLVYGTWLCSDTENFTLQDIINIFTATLPEEDSL